MNIVYYSTHPDFIQHSVDRRAQNLQIFNNDPIRLLFNNGKYDDP